MKACRDKGMQNKRMKVKEIWGGGMEQEKRKSRKVKKKK